MFWWIGGSLCGGISVVALVLLVFESKRQLAAKAALEQRIEREGLSVLGWIVMANTSLYRASNSKSHSYAVIVFTPRGDLPDLKKTLNEWAKKLHGYKLPMNAPNSKDERIIESIMRTQLPNPRALRLPDAITGGTEGYTISVRVPWRKLPGRKLTLPYLYCKVLFGDDGEALMIDYPDTP
jgi:hypothetical protein